MPRADFHPPDSATRVRASILLAVALHAAALLFWKIPPASPGTLENPQGAVEVFLVQEAPSAGSPPAETPAPTPVEPPKAEPPRSPPPPPEPPMADAPKPPDLLVTEPRLTPVPNLPPPPAPLPAPPPPAPTPQPVPEPPPPAEPPKPPQAPPQPEPPAPPKTTTTPPRATATAAKAAPSPVGPRAAQSVAQTPSLTTGPASTTGGSGQLTLVKPVYSVPPTVRYPSESRAANEQGTVVLRITVNGDGRPVTVTVAKSSGFTRLDRAAVEGGWRCRVQNAQAGAQFEAPLRFSLAQ